MNLQNATPLDDDASDLDLSAVPESIERAALACRAAGLLLPPVPAELADRLVPMGAFHFASHTLHPADRPAWMAAARDPATPTGLSFGHFGHGVNSWSLAYCLVLPALAVHIDLPYGGIYGDRAVQASQFNAVVERVEELIVLAEASARNGALKDGSRLMVAIGQAGGAWGLSRDDRWHDSAHPIEDALRALVAPAPAAG